MPLSVVYNGATYYYILSLQGDVVAILDSSGVSVVEYTYDAWGRLLTTTGSMSGSLGLHNPLRYRGYVYDRETGLYYLQSRYYNPELCRFISADSLGYLGADGTPQSYNLFAYCENNPIVLVSAARALPSEAPSVQASNPYGDFDSYGDVTNEIMTALTNAAAKGEMIRATHNTIFGVFTILGEFRQLVDHKAPWDIKRPESWKTTIGTEFPGYDVDVSFYEFVMTPQDLGNYSYGYLGRAYGIPFIILLAGSYYAADFPIYGEALLEEFRDWGYIYKGYCHQKG